MQLLQRSIGWAAIAFSFPATVLWGLAAVLPVQYTLDSIVGDLQRGNQWNAAAAGAAGIAALCSAAHHWLLIRRSS